MTDRDLLSAIHAEQMRAAAHVGRMDGKLAALSVRIGSVAADVSAIREGYVQQGLVLGQLQATCAQRGATCGARFKRISSEVGGVKEDTGVIHLEQVKRRAIWWTLAKVLAALVALAGLALGAVGAVSSCHGIAKLRSDAGRAQHVRVRIDDSPWCVTALEDMRSTLERRLPHGEWMRLATEDVPWPRWR